MMESPKYTQSVVFARTLYHNIWGESARALQHNAQLKVYPDGTATLLAAARPIIREDGWEAQGAARRPQPLADQEEVEQLVPLPEDDQGAAGEAPEGPNPESLARAKRRARAALVDLARSNDFGWFVTLTLDAAKVDRYDETQVIRKLNTWLSNQVARKGLCYVLVPEHHQDGAIHFHGLINGALTMVDSGTIKPAEGGRPRRPRSKAAAQRMLDAGGHPVYNVKEWGFGFSSAIQLYGDRRASIGYTAKYIGKESTKIGGRWYYSGGCPKRPSSWAVDVDWSKAADAAGEQGTFDIVELGCRACRIDYDGEGGGLRDWLDSIGPDD